MSCGCRKATPSAQCNSACNCNKLGNCHNRSAFPERWIKLAPGQNDNAEHDEDCEHELAFDLIREQQLKHCIEVANLQKQIDKNPFDKSVQVMRKNSNEEMLSRKYDRLFNKKAKEVK